MIRLGSFSLFLLEEIGGELWSKRVFQGFQAKVGQRKQFPWTIFIKQAWQRLAHFPRNKVGGLLAIIIIAFIEERESIRTRQIWNLQLGIDIWKFSLAENSGDEFAKELTVGFSV